MTVKDTYGSNTSGATGYDNIIGSNLLLPSKRPISLANCGISRGATNLPFRPQGVGNTQLATTSHAVSSAFPYNSVQLVFNNPSTSAVTVDKFIVSAGSTIYPGGVNNLANAGGAWSAVQGPITVPAGNSNGAQGAQTSPGVAVSAVIPLRSIARASGEADGGKYPLLFVRSYVASGNATAAYSEALFTNWTSIYNGANNLGITLQAGTTFSTDGVGTPGAITSVACSALPFYTFNGVIFGYDAANTTVAGVGDSVMAGSGDQVTGNIPYNQMAVSALQTLGKNVTYYNGSMPSGGILDFINNANYVITLVKPDILILPSHTVNSNHAVQGDFDIQWNAIMQIASQQIAAGGKVLLQTGFPRNQVLATEWACILNQNTRVRNSGLPYVDFAPFYGVNGAYLNPAWAAAGDNIHSSVLGNQAIFPSVQAALSLLVQ
jgi:lysophospholipase L1-like esterase